MAGAIAFKMLRNDASAVKDVSRILCRKHQRACVSEPRLLLPHLQCVIEVSLAITGPSSAAYLKHRN
jgi:hypothetical protein